MMEHDDKPTLQVVGDEQGDAESSKATKEALQRGLGRRGVYLLPNLITTGSLFAGFYAIITSMNGQPLTACLAIFLAMLLDGADGRIARMTGTQSAFGAQYDSLSDLVAFGVAPALGGVFLAIGTGQLGWVAALPTWPVQHCDLHGSTSMVKKAPSPALLAPRQPG